jgi:hypothetical protein
MIFFSSLFVAVNAPQYFRGTIDLLTKAENSLFVYDSDLRVFVNMLKTRLHADAPRKSTAYIDLHFSYRKRGCFIYVFPKKNTENIVARLSFNTVNTILEYDIEAGDMFDISERFVDLLKEGGAS